MVTNKKRCGKWIPLLLLTAAVAWLAGCTESGPHALLRGKRLIDEGKYADAVDELKTATSLLSTNAQAWNYLGLAYHHANQPANAVDAYQRALKLNHDLVAAHFNLGCLFLEQNKPDTLENARNELTAYVMRQGNSTDGWLKLGTAQLRLNELPQAEASFKEVLRLSPQNPEALNDLGIVQMQRKRTRDAAAYFNAALKFQPNYGPALLNMAVAQAYLNNPSLALQKYQEYLALSPRPANWDAVNAVAQQLDSQLNPPARPTNTAVATANPATNNPPRIAATPTNIAKPETVASVPRPVPPPLDTSVKTEVVQVPEAPSIKVAGTGATAPRTIAPPSTPDPQMFVDPRDVPPTNAPAKRGFFQRINPVSLFRHKDKPAGQSETPLGPTPNGTADTTPIFKDLDVASNVPPPKPQPIRIPRYTYTYPSRPSGGNRAEAERLSAQAQDAQRDSRANDALGFFRSAVKADPSYFEAQSGLGLAEYNAGNTLEALRAYELALAINPGSFTARFNFGLALKKAGYIQDAAIELERLLASSPAGEAPARLALVHLTLANLYAEQFHQTAPARTHYLKVLELDPHNSQGTAIRYWLQDNG